ncbi:RIP metalloprotease [Chloroflexota bacterium]
MMDLLITVVSFIGVLIVLVLAHECGHFFTARAAGVRIEEFGIGFPPRLFKIKRGQTIYSLNALPLGGFVKMAGEEDPTVSGSLASKSTWVRILVLASGSVMNALLPLLLFSLSFMIPHNAMSGRVTVEEVRANSPAEAAGIVAGDTILMINDKPVTHPVDVRRAVILKLGHEIDVLVEHSDSTRETVQMTPRWRPPEGDGAIGVLPGLSEATTIRESYPFWEAVPMSVSTCIETYIIYKNATISMFIGTVPADIRGPVGIAPIVGEAAQSGISYLLDFAAFFSVNLAIINIFPLPALDGGRIAFVLLEWIRRGKRVSPKIEGIVHTIGFFTLMAAMLAITYNDIIRLITGGN